jgi:hypothetical protein
MIKSPTKLENVKPSASRERAAKAAVIIAEYLKIHSLGASPKKLLEIILKLHPEWAQLEDESAGKLSTQSRLTNDVAWGKNALKDGGYTISKKESAQGGKEILKITDKGRAAKFSKEDNITWEQQFVLIQQGKI